MKIRRTLFFLSFIAVLSFAMNLKGHAGLEDSLDEDKIEEKFTKDISFGKEALLVLESLIAGGVINGSLNLVRKSKKSWEEILGFSIFVGAPQYCSYFLTRILVSKILSKLNVNGQAGEVSESLAIIASYFSTILFYHYVFYQKDSSIKEIFRDCSTVIISSFIFYLLFKYIKIFSKERRKSMIA